MSECHKIKLSNKKLLKCKININNTSYNINNTNKILFFINIQKNKQILDYSKNINLNLPCNLNKLYLSSDKLTHHTKKIKKAPYNCSIEYIIPDIFIKHKKLK